MAEYKASDEVGDLEHVECAGRDSVDKAVESAVKDWVDRLTEPAVKDSVDRLAEPVVKDSADRLAEPVVKDSVDWLAEPVVKDSVDQLAESAIKDRVEGVLDASEGRGVFKNVLFATMALEFGQGLQRGIFNNFVVEAVGINPAELGFVQGVREIPGLLTAPLAMLSRYFSENVYAGLCIITAAAGLLLHIGVSGVPMLLFATLVLSFGFHLFYPVQSSMIMKSCSPEERATRMGQLNSGAAASSLAAFAMVLMLSRAGGRTNYNLIHLVAGVSALLGGIMVLGRKTGTAGKPGTVIDFNIKYMSYYVLTFLGGARRHVNATFAGYLLVETYRTPVSTMVVLSAVSSLIAIFTRPVIGKIIDKWGEQRSLVFNYSMVAALFCCYAVVNVPLLLYLIYVLDTGLVGFDVAITTHLGKIAPKEVLSAEYAMGSTINHISGIAVPMIGGLVWDVVGAGAVFLGGAVIALMSMLYSRNLDQKERMALGA
ncbi:MAG: MFS transporter [Bacillota bacterium]